MKKQSLYALAGLAVIGAGASFARLSRRPSSLAVTPRPGDDTVVVNAMHRTRLGVSVLDRYGRRLRSDTAVRYQWISGDSIPLSSSGELQCARRGDAVVRATFGTLSREFSLRCRPVASIEAASWLDLVAGDSARDLSFVAHGPDGRAVTELRGGVAVDNRSLVDLKGTSIRPMHAGVTAATIAIGDRRARVPIVIYPLVTSFVGREKMPLMAMRVSLAQGDTIVVPVPKAAFWATYFSRQPSVPPPTIELVGEGSCTTGNGLDARRIEQGEYAKYCHTGDGTRLMIAHGAVGAARVTGVVALRLEW